VSTSESLSPEETERWSRAVEKGVCLHCEGDLGDAWREEDGPFCCRGCRSVYFLIRQSGLDRYYDLGRGQLAPPAQLRPDSFAWLDRMLDIQATDSGPVLHLSLDIQGVHCAACVWLLEELFRREAGGLELRINPSLGKVDLVWNTDRGELKDYLAGVEKFGYRLGPSRKGTVRHSRALLVRMAICIAVAMNVMMFSLSYYFGLAPGETLYVFFGRLSLGLATVSVIVGGQVFFRAAWAGLRRRMVHLDLPISLGMGLAYLGSVYAYFRDGPEGAYFDTLTVFVALMLVGRWAQEHILERNRNALLAAAGAEHLIVKRQGPDGLEAVPAPEIRTGDELWIAPGDLLPTEGILMRSAATVSLDWITGESQQRRFEPGATVPAGVFNAGQRGLSITATEDFADSRLQDLLRSGPSSAAGNNDFRPAWWNRVATYYVVAVLGLAALGFAVWVGHSPRQALEVTIAILVVTCPCALGLATPLAEELVHFALRRRGIFLRRADFLDKALAVRKLLLDKTGTLTLDELALTPEAEASLRHLGTADKQSLLFMTARSNHPVSRCLSAALRRELPGAGVQQPGRAAETLIEVPGQGLQWRRNGRGYALGKPEFAAGDAGATSTSATTAATTDHRRQVQRTLFTVDGAALAAFEFTERFHADASGELARLRRDGYESFLLSGDSPAKVATAAQFLDIPADRAFGGLNPEEKASLVRELDRNDTLMVGDGLNDSPSFEAALCAATPAVDRPVLPGKADFYFLGDGIAALRRTLVSARKLRGVVRVNLTISVLYNLVAVALCYAGLVSPVVAAVLMPVSSISVVALTAYRLSGSRIAWMS